MHFGLQAKISAFVISLIFLIGLGLFVLTFYHERVSIWNLRLSQINNVLSRTVAMVETPIYKLDVRELRSRISVMLHRGDLAFVWALDSEGRMISDGTRTNPMRNKKPDIGSLDELILINSNTMVELDGHFLFGRLVSLPDGEVLGIVVLGIDTEVFNRPFRETVFIQIIVLVTALILSIYAAIIFARRIIRPLNEVTYTAEQIGKGNWSKRVSYVAHDEIGDLASSVNLMAENLMKITVSRDDLVVAHDRIEQESARQIELVNDLAVSRDIAEAANTSKLCF